MKLSFIKGVVVGAVLFFVLSNLLDIPLTIYAMKATKGDNSQYAVINYIKDNFFLYAIEISTIIFSAILSGYVGAWIAKNNEIIVGLLSSSLSFGFAIYHIVLGYYTAFELKTILYILIPPVFGLIGGYLRFKQKQDVKQAHRVR